MASPSLQELLAEEGFKGKKPTTIYRSSFGSQAVSMPLYLYDEPNQLRPSSSVRIRTERTRSDVSRYSVGSEFQKTKGVRTRLPRDNLLGIGRIEKESNRKDLKETEMKESRLEIDSNVVPEIERFNSRLSVDLPGDEIVNEPRHRSDVHESLRFKDILPNEMAQSERGTNGYPNAFGENEKFKNNSTKHLRVHTSFSNSSRKNLLQPAPSYKKSTKTLNDRKHLDSERYVPEPALDEVAVQATVSILSGYIRRFLKDKEFRESLRHNVSSLLILTKSNESDYADNFILNLQEAIETVERVVEESGNAKDLKKASFQLSVITSLNSKDLKDGSMSGIPNAQLSACAHLYLSVIYMLQKKDKVSAKHLLQVFCDSPLQARTTLLLELWDYLFLPHLSHLRVWHDQEAASIPDTSNRQRKLKLLEKAYNEILDSGTYQFAAYYKDWLTEGVDAPAIPSIHIPSVSVQGFPRGSSYGHSLELTIPVGSVSSQPMISKKLYNTVFGYPNKLDVVDEAQSLKGEHTFDNCANNFGSTPEEDRKTLTYSPEQGRYTEQTFHGDTTTSAATDALHNADELLPSAKEGWQLPGIASREEGEVQNTHLWHKTQGSAHMSHKLPHKKANELILKKLAESIFRKPQVEDPIIHSKMSMHDSRKISKISTHVEGHYVNDEYFEDGSFFSNTPEDFICPLTGELFEDPVTLETGQTFERMAIEDWFDKGTRACPITGKTLECLGVPITNFVLKRVIDSWKSEHCRNLLALTAKIEGSASEYGIKSKDERAVLILEQLLIGFKTEDRLMNAKHLISLGGLQFLILRFELGNLEEKIRVAGLLSCCIEADGGCRNYIAKNINKTCLLQLLHNKQVKSRANAVMLLTELICLNRRTEITSFLNSMQEEGIMNTMHVLLVYLQSSPPDQRPLVAVLLLHLDHLVEPQKYSIYREEAIDSITVALECSLNDEKVRAQCCRVLLILGGHISFSGELLIENWLLGHAGFYDGSNTNNLDETLAEEETAREDWSRNLAASLLGNGKKSFLEIVAKCLGSGDSSLVRTCLITVAWLSQALTLLSDTEFQLSAFSAFIPRLKESLENDCRIEHRVLASMTLFNFSRISECRVLLMTIGEEILVPLQSLAVATWTAKKLLAIIFGERMQNITGKEC